MTKKRLFLISFFSLLLGFTLIGCKEPDSESYAEPEFKTGGVIIVRNNSTNSYLNPYKK